MDGLSAQRVHAHVMGFAVNAVLARRRGFWLITLATLVVVGVTASLGIWQLARAQQKRALQDSISARMVLPAWTVRDLIGPAQPTEAWHRPVNLVGRWLPAHTVFLDNRPMNSRSGFYVLTALRLSGSERAVLVQRGWVPRDFMDRQRLPEVPTPEGEVQVQGRLAPPPSQLFELGAAVPGPIRQNVDLAQLSREWGVVLLGGLSVLQTGSDDAGLVRDWPDFEGGQHKHLAYAAQWFAMSTIAAGLYTWFQFLQPRVRRKTHGSDAR